MTNRIIRNLKIKLFGFIVLVSLGCDGQGDPNFDYGKVEGDQYVNSYFNFEIKLPSGWIVRTSEQTENLVKRGKKLLVGDDSKMQAAVDAAEVNVANLLMVSQFEQGAAVAYNPSIIIVAENIKNSPGIKTGSDYLFRARRLLEQSKFKYDSIDSKFVKEVIGGVDFYKMGAQVTYVGIVIRQIYYATILKGFSFNFIISYADDTQRNELISMINSTKFKN